MSDAPLIDDEAPARRRIVRLLESLDVEVAGEAGNGVEAIDVMAQTHPDLLLLDIHMPELDGLALAARYAHVPAVVFVTAHNEHAVRAFELGAIDYLLKPVRVERLAKALERASSRVAAQLRGERAPWPSLPSSPTEVPRVVTYERGTTCLFDARPITRFRSAEKYTIFMAGGEEHLTEEPLNALEIRLVAHGFLRVHRAELVRTTAILGLRSDDRGHAAQLEDGQLARVSRRLVTPLKRALGL